MRFGLMVLIFAFLYVNVFGQGQKLSPANKKAVKYYRQAENAYRHNESQKALSFLDKAIIKDPEFIEAWLFKGDILEGEGKTKEAIESFKKAAALDSLFFPQVWAILGRLYYEAGDYGLSVKAYQTFLRIGKIPEERKNTVLKLLKISEQAMALLEENKGLEVTPLDSNVNTSGDEYVNFVDAADNELIFTRKEKYYDSKIQRQVVKESFYHYFMKDTLKTTPEILNISWIKSRNVGSLSFSADGRKIFFAGCGWENGFGSCDIYCAEKQDNRWLKPVNVGKAVNSKGWESQPVISVDGKHLYFASKRRGGKGGSDIWMSVKLPGGRWSPPVNLGDSINTPGNEMAPFLYADDKTLIFSSDGWPSLGGKDLFISRKNKAGIWTKAKNIGAPVNTKSNEINLIYSLDGKTVWFSSDRNNGNYDIFQLPVFDKIKPAQILFVNGEVVDDNTGKNIGNVVVLLTNLTLKKLQDSLVTDSGSGKFLIVLNKPAKYAFNLFAEGYLPYSETFDFDSSLINHWKYEKVFRLKKIKKGNSFVLQNIYFDLDQYVLKAESFPELDRLVIFLKKNKNIKLEIIGHTDNTGTRQYNLQLSEQRARAVLQYLVKKGVEPERLTFKGVGAEQPLVPNETEGQRAINRRVVFVVR